MNTIRTFFSDYQDHIINMGSDVFSGVLAGTILFFTTIQIRKWKASFDRRKKELKNVPPVGSSILYAPNAKGHSPSVLNKETCPPEFKSVFEQLDFRFSVYEVVVILKKEKRHARTSLEINDAGYFEVCKVVDGIEEYTLPKTTLSRVNLNLWHNRRHPNFTTYIYFGAFGQDTVYYIEITNISMANPGSQVAYKIGVKTAPEKTKRIINFVDNNLYRKGTPDELYFSN